MQMRRLEANLYANLAVEHCVRRITCIRHMHTQSRILYTRQYVTASEWRRVAGQRCLRCRVARARIDAMRCEK